MPLSLIDLPQKLLASICRYLDPTEFARLSCSCRTFRHLFDSDIVWEDYIRREFNIPKFSYQYLSSKIFYKRILRNFKFALGLWFMDFPHTGGLMRVSVHNGTLLAEEIVAPVVQSDVFSPTTMRNLFRVRYDRRSKRAKIDCLLGKELMPSVDCLQGTLFKVIERSDGRLFMRCTSGKTHTEKLALANLDVQDPHRKKIEFTRGYKRWVLNNFQCICKKIIVPTFPTPIRFQPGFFKGSFNDHGVELLVLAYVDGTGKALHGAKVTGDPNVPAMQMSFFVYFNQSYFPDISQQHSLKSLKEMPPTFNDFPPSFEPQPFYMPRRLHVEVRGFRVPDTCMGRFNSELLVAGPNFTNPSYIRAQMIFFNYSLLGMIVYEMNSMLIFHRAAHFS